MPNWNSWTMPVTSPSAKLIVKSLPRNFAIRRWPSSRVRIQREWYQATIADSPIVTGTKKKWYTVVMANCHRARSRTSTKSPTSISTT